MIQGIFLRRRGKNILFLYALSIRFVAAAELNVPDDYSTIQAAIDAASSGDSIVVAAGTYTENVLLKSGVDVRGAEAARTFLEPETSDDPVVLADGIDDVLFANFTIFNALLGFDVINSTNLQVANSVFDSIEQVALQIDADSQVDVLNCVFWNNVNAIRRGTEEAQITNVGFIGNVVTINSPIASIINPNTNVDNCGFFDNEDLKDAGVDLSYGTDAVIGDPLFAATEDFDFHLREDSPFIDVGLGTDVIDNTTADIGAYGGEFADSRPYPVAAPIVTDASSASPPPYSVKLDWSANLAYLVTNTVMPGSYRVYYVQNQSGPPYDGTDAGNGTELLPVDAGDNTTLTLDDLQPSVPPPDSPQLLSVEPLSTSAVVNWTAVSGASDYRVYYGVASVDENLVDTGDTTSFTVTGLENDIEYQFAVSALAQSVYHFSITARDSTQNKNESVFSPESTLAVGPLTEGMQSNVLTATPEVTTPYPDLPDKGCFVATAAFGVDWSAEVRILRDFRDRYLVTNRPGRVFVRWYYRNGPVAAAFISEFDSVRAVVRALLWPAVIIALLFLSAPPVASFILLGLCFSLLVVRQRNTFQKYSAWPFE
jgi:hypothetical protein